MVLGRMEVRTYIYIYHLLLIHETANTNGNLNIDIECVEDVLQIGQASSRRQRIGLATHQPQGLGSSGILGLGFSSLNTMRPKGQTIFDALIPTLQLPLFSVNLNAIGESTFYFGYTDGSKYTGQITSTSIVPFSAWRNSNPGY